MARAFALRDLWGQTVPWPALETPATVAATVNVMGVQVLRFVGATLAGQAKLAISVEPEGWWKTLLGHVEMSTVTS